MDQKSQGQQLNTNLLLQIIGRSEVEKELLRMQIQRLQEKINESNQGKPTSVP